MNFRLRNLKAEDADGMLEWMHDPEINSVFGTTFESFDKEKVLCFIENAQDMSGESIHLACVDEHDQYLGTVSLKNIDHVNSRAEYAISMRRRAHSTGASKYASEEILRIAFEELGLARVYLFLFALNERADNFYNKFGFIYEGTFVKHIRLRGELCDVKWYRMLKEEWVERKTIKDQVAF